MLEERGVAVDHAGLNRRVLKYTFYFRKGVLQMKKGGGSVRRRRQGGGSPDRKSNVYTII